MSTAAQTPEDATPSQPDLAGTVAPPLADQVFSTLRAWIVNGDLQAGHRLRVRDIADTVGTSVMPVREAIRRLVESGLAIHEPYKGAKVRGLDIAELEQAYDVRILLEADCARLGAEAAVDGVADRMLEHWVQLERAALAGDVSTAIAQDELLLGSLYEAAGNDIALEIIHSLWDRCRPYKIVWASGSTGQADDVGLWHHKPDLIEAVRAHDGTAAERILHTSYLEAKSAIRDNLVEVKADSDAVSR